MEQLDLNRHDPEDYEGKCVTCNGRDYELGAHLGTGAERICHKLINRRSGLCLHVLKVLRYPRPVGLYTEIIARLRGSPQNNFDLARGIPITIEIGIPGGTAEVQTYVGPYSDDANPTTALMHKGDAKLAAEEYNAAIANYKQVLELNPQHTVAMLNLAAALKETKDEYGAWILVSKAREIEPHYLPYQHAYIAYSTNLGHIRIALQALSEAKVIFPHVYDLDSLGAKLCLIAGNPEAVTPYIERALLSDSDKTRLRNEAEQAVERKSRTLELCSRARLRVEVKDWESSLELLREAYAVYENDPFVTINYALALRRSGQYEPAAALLIRANSIVHELLQPFCIANAAFSLIEGGNLGSAIHLLEWGAQILTILHHGELPTNCADLPGVGIWVEEERLLEEWIGTAHEFIQGAMQGVPGGKEIPEEVVKLANAYHIATSGAG